MKKQEYIQQELVSATQSLLSVLLFPFGAITILLLSVLDYFVTPENFAKFLFYRILFASIMMCEYFILKLKKNNKIIQNIITIAGAVTTSIMVELMIFSFGGHQSPYYAGMIIVLVFVLGFVPLSLTMTVLSSCLVYAIYCIPILLLDDITNLRIFLNNNIFLISFVFGGFAWRYYNNRLFINKLSLEYDLEKSQQALKFYSEQLEKLVAERTRELKRSETMLRSLFDNANDTIILTDENGKIIDINSRVVEQYGYTREELIGKSALSLEKEPNNRLFLERYYRLLHGEPLVYETTHLSKNDSPLYVEVSANAVTLEEGRVVQFIIRNITEKKKLHAQLLHAQRMESLGTLTSGIAHDFNNLLTSIVGYTDLILDEDKLPTDIVSKIRVIESSARKATQIVNKLLNFAKKGRELEIVPFNVNDIIHEALELAHRRFRADIDLKLNLREDLPIIKGDVGLLEQCALNLILNAIDAMPDGGTLEIETELVNIDRNFNKPIAPDLKEGPYIRMTFRDTGVGIPQDKIDKIFDPFFTTKGPDKGTGLGLAMTYGIVKDHGGYITVESTAQKGTTFEIYLPASQLVMPGIKPCMDILRTTGKIIVLDDEVPILEFFKSALLQEGFNVVIFNEPYAAYEYFKENRNLVELIITDIMMPKIDGSKLIDGFRSIKPDIKIIAMSGIKEAFMDIKANGYLFKPIKRESVLEEIHRVMTPPDRNC